MPGPGGARGLSFPPDSVSEPRRGCSSSCRIPGLLMRTCLCSLFAGTLLNASLFSPARRSSFFSLFLDSRLSPPTERKKKKKGHVCLEKYVGQWNISCTGAKGEEGSGGGEGAAAWSSGCALLAAGPEPYRRGSFPSLTHFPDQLRSPRKKQ